MNSRPQVFGPSARSCAILPAADGVACFLGLDFICLIRRFVVIRRAFPQFWAVMLIVFPASSQTTNRRQENIRICTQFSGPDAGAKIAACIADLPSTGGIADARGFEGTQTVSQNIFDGITKPVTLFLCAASLHVSVTQTVAAT